MATVPTSESQPPPLDISDTASLGHSRQQDIKRFPAKSEVGPTIIANFPYDMLINDPKFKSTYAISVNTAEGKDTTLVYCKKYIDQGSCPYGIKCKYPHPHEYEKDPRMSYQLDVLKGSVRHINEVVLNISDMVNKLADKIDKLETTIKNQKCGAPGGTRSHESISNVSYDYPATSQSRGQRNKSRGRRSGSRPRDLSKDRLREQRLARYEEKQVHGLQKRLEYGP